MSIAAQTTHIFWDVFRKCVNSPLQMRGKPDSTEVDPQSLGLWCGGWHLTWAHFAFSKSLIDCCCQDGYYPGICLFHRLAVQSHFTQQCQMKIPKGKEDTQKALLNPWWLDFHHITVFKEWAEIELNLAADFGKLIFFLPKTCVASLAFLDHINLITSTSLTGCWVSLRPQAQCWDWSTALWESESHPPSTEHSFY